MPIVMRAENISKKFFRKSDKANFFYAVKPQDFELEEGTLTVISGRSGSGKTTFLSMLAGLLTPSDGNIYLKEGSGEKNLYQMNDEQRSRLRSGRIGMIPQGRTVADNLTVLENILLPGLFGSSRSEEEAEKMLQELEIGHLRDARVTELSGGEVRRVSIVRALLGRPDVILADEPTGDLDDENTELVLQRFKKETARGAAVVLVSHDPAVRAYADREFRMDAGELYFCE